MAKTKATIRRLNRPTFAAAPGQRIGNKNIINSRESMLKIKTPFPQIKQVEVKNNRQVVRRMTVKRKSHYFSGNRGLRF